MIRSMTGFGEAERPLQDRRLRVTIKTVNHRFFNAHLRTPPGFERFESQIQQWLRPFFSRGHVTFALALERERDRERAEAGLPEVDMVRARHYRDLLAGLVTELDLQGGVELSALLRFGDILRAPESVAAEIEVEESLLKEITEEAARAVLAMREREGAELAQDLRGRLARMGEELSAIEARAPERLVEERDRLREAIRELAQQESVDEDRLAKELAYTAERWDINEELVRFRSHLTVFGEALADGEGEPLGKRLGFLVQEMHREANTIASKANDVVIAHASIAIREEIERLREQLENIE